MDNISVEDLRKILHHQKDAIEDALRLLHNGDSIGACAAVTIVNTVVSGVVTRYMVQSELIECRKEL